MTYYVVFTDVSKTQVQTVTQYADEASIPEGVVYEVYDETNPVHNPSLLVEPVEEVEETETINVENFYDIFGEDELTAYFNGLDANNIKIRKIESKLAHRTDPIEVTEDGLGMYLDDLVIAEVISEERRTEILG